MLLPGILVLRRKINTALTRLLNICYLVCHSVIQIYAYKQELRVGVELVAFTA